MKYQRGIITPALIILGLIVLGGLAYYSLKSSPGKETATSTPAAVVESNSGEETTSSVTASGEAEGSVQPESETRPSGGATEPGTPAPSQSPETPSYSSPLVQVTEAGTLAQRLGLTTLTDLDYSFAVSYPRDWTSAGPSNLVTVTNGRSTVVIASQDVPPGTTPQGLAGLNGVFDGIVTTSVNAYTALETITGSQTTYYIVNGSVGYKIIVTDAGDSSVLHTILLTFTVTKQR